MTEKIDFVITWVDGNDPEWRKERDYYAELEHRDIDNHNIRYRDWETLRYWFRGVEKFAPWVNKIYFVTWGHVPEWLNTAHPKLQIVKHSDFIPSEYLPTYNSNVIEFYFHQIKGLSEQFVYFNDDFFLIDSVKPERFFRKGLPCDMGALVEHTRQGIMGCSVFLAQGLINGHFNKRDAVKKNFHKWFNFIYPYYSLRNLLYLKIRKSAFNGFEDHHLAQGYLKKTYDEVWRNCAEDLVRTSYNRFRQYGDVAFWLIRYWQLASGSFFPYNTEKDGVCIPIEERRMKEIVDCISRQKKKIICLNDTEISTNYENAKQEILAAFESILPSKCSFEYE